ncbi:hypothetical protein J1N35_001001 [Gossypium stocksii]|uniref:Uncharacterized protein n=1 Tax=Gossypium stocksii TaxID=47602 RepID=A0A9D3WJF3_9ROSI|nr:hypothetical protein J1N35_001001 [Gossypium stocksii]
MKIPSRRDDRLLHEDPSSYSQRKASHFDDSFLLFSFCNEIEKAFSEDSINKFHLHYLPDERCFRLIEKGKNKNGPSPPALKGDALERIPPKEGGRENNPFSSRTICGS